MSFLEFSRGDVRQGGSSLPITNGRIAVDGGAALVALLRQGLAGFHKGTVRGTVSFTIPVVRDGSGPTKAMIKNVIKTRTVKVTAMIDDTCAIEVEGIMRSFSGSMAESSMMSGDHAVEGVLTLVDL